MKKIVLKIVFLMSIILLLLTGFNTSMATGINNEKARMLGSQIQTTNSIQTVNGIDINSNRYLVSEVYSYIGRILPKTTIIQFKTNFNVPSESIHVYKDKNSQQEIKDGYIGTNMAVKFDNTEKVYETSIVGDFNGDGLSNQIEIQKIIKYIVYGKNDELEGLKLLSADVNGDGTINQIDLSILINYVVFGRLSINEVNKPQKPTIEVISGETSENGIYVTEVTVKITPTETENVEKTTYTISGSMEVEETPIPANGQITLSNDGTYTIRSYTYFTDGARSDAAELSIKKVVTGIPLDVIGLSIKLDSESGEDYAVGEWTGHNICITTYPTVEKFGDNAEVKVETKYTISGAKEMPIPVKTPTLLTSTGDYEVTAIATDELGRTKIKTYTIKMDKDLPESSTIEISGGEETASGWYTQDITATVTHGSDALSGLDKVTYELTGAQKLTETEIENAGTIQFTTNGITKLIIRTYDVAGNVAILEKDIKIDKDKPTNLELEASEITSTSFKLTAKAQDSISGIKKYEFFLDGSTYKTVTTSEETVTIPVTSMKTTKHSVKIVVTDNAENTEEKTIEVANTALQNAEVQNVIFEITSFSVAEENENKDTYFNKVISDTSLSTVSKYIQLSSQLHSVDNKTGEIQGKVKILRTDGIEIDEVEYFPTDMTFTVGYESNGSGTTFSHKTVAEIFGEVLQSQDAATAKVEHVTKEIRVADLLGKETKTSGFKIIEKKTTGTSSSTMLTISNVKLGGRDIEFKIVDSTGDA